MRASELIRKLQEFMEDYHCDPEIRVESSSQRRYRDNEVTIQSENILDAEFYHSRPYFSRVVLRKSKKFPQITEIIE